ncbi:MAG TPA: energy transducer TonB [Candidatus Binatia bacterium]|nr:energy transducer TonB [Candidatus Binatia bacterium]
MRAAVFLAIYSLCLFLSLVSRAQDVQARGEALLKRAREVSDIRGAKAPGFRLTATFTFVDKNLAQEAGTFTEVWVSDSRWRRETVVKDLHRVEVAGPTRRWLLEGGDDYPDRAARVATEMQFLPDGNEIFNFESIKDHPEKDPPYECAITKRGPHQEASGFCFDKKTGILIESAFPELRASKIGEPLRPVEHTCSYNSFRRFGNLWFPREMECLEDGHKEITLHVAELSAESSPDPGLFLPPPGALELANCRGMLVPPKAISGPEARLPSVTSTPSRVLLWLIVDTKGHPQNVKVINDGGQKDRNRMAVETARAWRFNPARCDGEPVPFPAKLELDFHFVH